MAQHCQFCGKIPMTGHRISHAHNVTNRKWHLNLKEVSGVREVVRKYNIPKAGEKI